MSVQAQSVACLLRSLLSRSHNQGKYTLQRTLYLGKPAHYSPPRNNLVKRRATGKGNAINVLGRKYRMICRKPSALFNEFPFFLFSIDFFLLNKCKKCKIGKFCKNFVVNSRADWRIGQRLLKVFYKYWDFWGILGNLGNLENVGILKNFENLENFENLDHVLILALEYFNDIPSIVISIIFINWNNGN